MASVAPRWCGSCLQERATPFTGTVLTAPSSYAFDLVLGTGTGLALSRWAPGRVPSISAYISLSIEQQACYLIDACALPATC